MLASMRPYPISIIMLILSMECVKFSPIPLIVVSFVLSDFPLVLLIPSF